MNDPVEWGRSIAKAFKEHLAEALEPINARLKALEEREPVELTVEETEPVDVDALVADAVAKAVSEIPVPKDGRDGIDGKDGESVDPAEVERMVSEAVAKAVADIPAPKDGKDADPEVIRQMVAEAVAEIPKPQDGKDADPVEVERMVGEAVEKAVSAIPTPKDGKDADPETIRQMVADAVAEIPKPENGKDADPEEVKRLVLEAVEAIPKPRDGKDADPEEVERLVSERVAKAVSEALPALIDEAKAELAGMVQKAADAIPVPRDGKDATQIDILPTIDFGKTYERGTWAMHDGGLWRAHSNTVGSRGWECVMRGVAKVEQEWENERTLIRREILSDGTVHETRQSFPMMIYRGTFSESSAYDIGDTVTWGGSTWILESEMKGKPGEPGVETGWKLIVKKGRDAK